MYFGHVQHGLHVALEAREFTAVFLGAEDQLDGEKLRRFFPAGHPFQGIVLVGEVQQHLGGVTVAHVLRAGNHHAGLFARIDATGKVKWVYLEESTLGDRDTEKCVLETLAGALARFARERGAVPAPAPAT